MKKCPNCNQTFPDDSFFCLEEGSTLIPVLQTTENLPVFPTPDSAPTQVVSRPHSQQVSDSSKWLYLIMGVMATTIVALGIAFYFSRPTNEKETASKTTEESSNKVIREKSNKASEEKATTSQNNSTSENTGSQIVVQNTNIAVSTPRPLPSINPNLNPTGRWTGDWTSPSGAYLTAEVNFSDNGSGQIHGQIVWTLRQTADPKKISKIGYTAIEFVKGGFNPETRHLSLIGYRKDDPNNVLANLDTFRLILNENNQQIAGTTRNFGRWNGRFNLRRF